MSTVRSGSAAVKVRTGSSEVWRRAETPRNGSNWMNLMTFLEDDQAQDLSSNIGNSEWNSRTYFSMLNGGQDLTLPFYLLIADIPIIPSTSKEIKDVAEAPRKPAWNNIQSTFWHRHPFKCHTPSEKWYLQERQGRSVQGSPPNCWKAI